VLSQRIVTAAVLVALLLGGLLAGDQKLWALLLGGFVSIAAWEWSCLAGCRQVTSRVVYTLLITLVLPCLYIFASPWTAGVVLFGTVWWCVAAIMVFYYQAGGQPVPASRPACYLLGCFVLIPAWAGLVGLYPLAQGPALLLLFFIMIFLVDSTAFFAGRRWGKRKLASRVSPGKTWEGFVAGVLVSLVPALVYVLYEDVPAPAGVGLVLLCVASAIFSVIGDLFMSVMKRHANVKDSSRILPGHGGVLDRIDSITASAPLFTSGLWILEGKL